MWIYRRMLKISYKDRVTKCERSRGKAVVNKNGEAKKAIWTFVKRWRVTEDSFWKGEWHKTTGSTWTKDIFKWTNMRTVFDM